MNDFGLIGILLGALVLFFMGKQHEKKQVIRRTAKKILEDKQKEQEIKDEVAKSDLESLVASNNEHFKSK